MQTTNNELAGWGSCIFCARRNDPHTNPSSSYAQGQNTSDLNALGTGSTRLSSKCLLWIWPRNYASQPLVFFLLRTESGDACACTTSHPAPLSKQHGSRLQRCGHALQGPLRDFPPATVPHPDLPTPALDLLRTPPSAPGRLCPPFPSFPSRLSHVFSSRLLCLSLESSRIVRFVLIEQTKTN